MPDNPPVLKGKLYRNYLALIYFLCALQVEIQLQELSLLNFEEKTLNAKIELNFMMKNESYDDM